MHAVRAWWMENSGNTKHNKMYKLLINHLQQLVIQCVSCTLYCVQLRYDNICVEADLPLINSKCLYLFVGHWVLAARNKETCEQNKRLGVQKLTMCAQKMQKLIFAGLVTYIEMPTLLLPYYPWPVLRFRSIAFLSKWQSIDTS